MPVITKLVFSFTPEIPFALKISIKFSCCFCYGSGK